MCDSNFVPKVTAVQLSIKHAGTAMKATGIPVAKGTALAFFVEDAKKVSAKAFFTTDAIQSKTVKITGIWS